MEYRKNFSDMKKYELYCGDCADVMSRIDDESVDLTITSPPYDTLRSYKGSADDWCFEKFVHVADELIRVTKHGGVVVWIVGDGTVEGSETGTSLRHALHFKDIGFKLHDTMIWNKTNPMPQVAQPRYSQAFEYMFVLTKGAPKTFHPMMVKCKCAGRIYDSTCKNMGGENGRTSKMFAINSEKVASNVWDVAIARNKTPHPAVFPIELVRRHISTWTDEGDVVLDPFMGSGTTGLACAEMGRVFVGIERCGDFFAYAEREIQTAMSRPRQMSLF